MQIPTAKANRNRVSFYSDQIIRVIKNNNKPRILSIACGPAREVINTLLNYPLAIRASFTCVDFEKNALKYVHEKIETIERETHNKIDISFKRVDILELVRRDELLKLSQNQDLIYSSGLVDYFSDKIVSRLIEILFKGLNEEGRLIIGNVSSEDPHRGYTELLGDWYINHRNENDMRRLADKIKGKITIEKEKETGMNIFMIIDKK